MGQWVNHTFTHSCPYMHVHLISFRSFSTVVVLPPEVDGMILYLRNWNEKFIHKRLYEVPYDKNIVRGINYSDSLLCILIFYPFVSYNIRREYLRVVCIVVISNTLQDIISLTNCKQLYSIKLSKSSMILESSSQVIGNQPLF